MFKRNNTAKHRFKQAGFWLLLSGVFICILLWRESTLLQKPEIKALTSAPSNYSQPFIEASDRSFAYRLLLFWLQQFDVQSGQYVSYRQLNYTRVIGWLDLLSRMEPESQYPMLLATRIYTKVADPDRKRLMLNYVFESYKLNPVKNWRWLAEATITAMHSLNDLELALVYATALANDNNREVPYWAKDLRLLILEGMGEVEQVKLLVGGLLANKTITDENEIRFLGILLNRLQKNDK